MLAGWVRLKYPHLIHAAVSSSAPVQAQANFQGYNDVVAASMANTGVGGSTACASAIQKGFQVCRRAGHARVFFSEFLAEGGVDVSCQSTELVILGD